MHPTVIRNSLGPSIDQVNEALKAEMHEKEKTLEKRWFFALWKKWEWERTTQPTCIDVMTKRFLSFFPFKNCHSPDNRACPALCHNSFGTMPFPPLPVYMVHWPDCNPPLPDNMLLCPDNMKKISSPDAFSSATIAWMMIVTPRSTHNRQFDVVSSEWGAYVCNFLNQPHAT